MKNKAGDQSLVRISNQRTIIEYIRKKGPTSKADLAKELEISKPTVAKNVEILIREEILYEYGEGISSGGRKPLLIGFNSNFRYVLSLSINVDYPMIAIFDLNGRIKNKMKINVPRNISEQDFFNIIYENIEKVFKSVDIEDKKIGVISVSTPGIIDEETGEIFANPQFDNWNAINLKKELNKRFDKRIIVKNDVSMSALGEKHYGIGKSYNNLIYLSSTLGIGAGLILKGQLYEGIRKAAGEVGYFLTKDNLDNGSNFEKGYSIPKIIDKIQYKVENNKSSIIYNLTDNGKKDVNLEMIIEAINLADSFVLDEITDIGKTYGVFISNIAILLDLEAVIIGGSLGELGIRFLHIISETISNNTPIDVKVLPSGLRENAGLYGTYIVGNHYITEKLVK